MKGNSSALKSPITADTSVWMNMTDNTDDGKAPKGRAIPGTKRVDGTYTPAVVPPEWEA